MSVYIDLSGRRETRAPQNVSYLNNIALSGNMLYSHGSKPKTRTQFVAL
jgi:hypothetical protein